jgi:hypothetical protein
MDILGENVIGVTRLRSYAGKASHTASIIPTWRPFLNEIWAALKAVNSGRSGSAPMNTIWVEQIRHSLTWLASFLSPARNPDWERDTAGNLLGLRRIWTLESYIGAGAPITLTWDSSPFGLGAFLEEGEEVVAYFAAPLTEDDVRVFGHPIGSSNGQQTWEALAPLCALRIWKDRWRFRRVRLRARGDNIASLTLLLNLRAKGEGPGIIAREMALELGDGCHAPDLIEHLPGVVNIEADSLSRRYDPEKAPWSLPWAFRQVTETVLPPRPASFYHTMQPPRIPQGTREARRGSLGRKM